MSCEVKCFDHWDYMVEAENLLDRLRGQPLNWELYDENDQDQGSRLSDYFDLVIQIADHLEKGRMVIFKETEAGFELSVYE